jgi:glycosyltransferase involved in cell wall biosynthesis
MATVGLDTSALDVSFKEHAGRGIGRYVRELKGYFDRESDAAMSAQAGRGANELVDIAYFDHADIVSDKAVNWLPAGRMTIKQQLLYPVRLGRESRKREIDCLHFPAHMDAPSWSPLPYAVTVLDLIPLICADLYKADSPSWRFALARWFELRGIRNAALVLAISQCTADDVHRLLGVPYERIVVTPLGVDEGFFNAALPDDVPGFDRRFGLDEKRPLLLYVGGIDQRKNAPGMIHALAEVAGRCDRNGTPRPQLLMAGGIQRDKQFPTLLKAIEQHCVADCVLLPGYVADEDLLRLYARADVFLFLSLYEGFGLPALEAMAAGLPLVCSNRSAMPEVVGDAGLLVDPTNPRQAAEAILGLLENKELANDFSRRGVERAKLFPWSQTGLTTLFAYEQLSSSVARPVSPRLSKQEKAVTAVHIGGSA